VFINFWYPASRSEELGDQPLAVRMLAQDFVLFRDGAGRARCLSNVCTHRGGSLADGRRRGDCIECPYHGWQFDGDGRCLRIPSLGAEAKIPPRTRVDSYPVQERYGLVFVFLGDLPEAERIPIMEVPEWGREGWRATSMTFRWDVDYKRSLENALDPAHNEYVHTTHIDKKEEQPFAIPPLEIIEHAHGAGFHIRMPGPPLHDPKMREVSGRVRPGVVNVHAGHHGVASFWTYVQINDFYRHQYFFETPVEPGRVVIHTINLRNAMLDPADDERTMNMDRLVMEQDARVLRGVRPLLPPASALRENLVPSDRHAVRYRERLQEWQARGWRIDTERAARDSQRAVYVIPSPQRRLVGNWTFEAVPLLPGTPGQAR
jgi:phenylpropionate dioxygenase-like ring-hydroxylating dioxygenase large terminal subunit